MKPAGYGYVRRDRTEENTPSYERKEGNRAVNIFRKRSHCVKGSLSAHCDNSCIALQNNGFCVVKAALLQCKTVAFALQLINENEEISKLV
ncbi:hypothetical protein [Prevotella nigrescens]|uniref:hypothetical protein n=1 Tax=Prevotella nigrescens TaxID=28133 RepID=UPI001C603E54|nr:hypothetical protein [Prevotella nigrescens]MBW4727607.1 hypothetical protein [Prevotella nigrescens]